MPTIQKTDKMEALVDKNAANEYRAYSILLCMNPSYTYMEWLKKVQGTWVEVSTKFFFNSAVNAIDPDTGNVYHLTRYSEIRNDKRIGKVKCCFCGNTYSDKEIVCPICHSKIKEVFRR